MSFTIPKSPPPAPIPRSEESSHYYGPTTSYPTGFTVPKKLPAEPGTRGSLLTEGMFYTPDPPQDPNTPDYDTATAIINEITQAKRDETYANTAYAALSQEANDFLYGENGIFSRKGMNAATAVDDITAFYTTSIERHSKGLNPESQQLFTTMANRSRLSVQGAAAKYSGRETHQAAFDSIKARTAADKTLAINGYTSDRAYLLAREAALDGAHRVAVFNEMDEETTAAFVNQARSEMDKDRVLRHLERGNLEQAASLAESGDFIPMHHEEAFQAVALERQRREAEQQRIASQTRKQAATLLASQKHDLNRALQTGDFTAMDQARDTLAASGMEQEAADFQTKLDLYKQGHETVKAVADEPFTARSQQVQAKLEALRQPGSEPGAEALAAVQAQLQRDEDRFRDDPAGYVESRQDPQQSAAFDEQGIRRNLNEQFFLAKELPGYTPRILSESRAADIRNQYDTLVKPAEKAGLLRTVAVSSGPFATRALAEAGLPSSVAVFTPVMSGLAQSQTGKLIQATETPLDDMPISDARKEAIRKQVADSSLAQALLGASSAMSAMEGALSGDEAASYGNLAEEAVAALEGFVALGGNLRDLENRVTREGMKLVKGLLSGSAGMIEAASLPTRQPKGGKKKAEKVEEAAKDQETSVKRKAPATGDQAAPADQNDEPPLPQDETGLAPESENVAAEAEPAEAGAKPERTYWEQNAHKLGVGLRGLTSGLGYLADGVTTPIRESVNLVAALLGQPKVFQMLGVTLPDLTGLPEAETLEEEVGVAMGQGAVGAVGMVWSANALLTYLEATGIPNMASRVFAGLSAAPEAQVVAGMGAELGAFAADKAGWGPYGAAGAGMISDAMASALTKRAVRGKGPLREASTGKNAQSIRGGTLVPNNPENQGRRLAVEFEEIPHPKRSGETVKAKLKEALIKEDFCSLTRKASSGRSEVYQDIHELRTGRA